jgi:hypothetical protein
MGGDLTPPGFRSVCHSSNMPPTESAPHCPSPDAGASPTAAAQSGPNPCHEGELNGQLSGCGHDRALRPLELVFIAIPDWIVPHSIHERLGQREPSSPYHQCLADDASLARRSAWPRLWYTSITDCLRRARGRYRARSCGRSCRSLVLELERARRADRAHRKRAALECRSAPGTLASNLAGMPRCR